MFIFLKKTKENLSNWVLKKSASRHSKIWLAILSFAESSFFPIPPDFLLITILMTPERKRWLYYATITTIYSVLGGIFGYFIGFFFFKFFGKPLITFYHLENNFDLVSTFFQKNNFLAIFTASFTPIPYKVFTIAGGLFKINLLTFITASILGRGLRFFIVSYLMKIYGQKISALIYKYFNLFSLILIILLILIIYLIQI